MKVKTLSLLAGAGAMMIAGTASAGTSDMLSISLHNTWENGGNTYDVYRLYANLSGTGFSGVAYWGGEPGILTFGINNILLEGGSGSGFYQTGFAGSALVQQNNALYQAFADEFDNSTYFTIGNAAGYTPALDGEGNPFVFQLTPQFDPAVNGQTSIGGNGGTVTTPDSPYVLPDDNGMVLLAQFSVISGEHVEGTIGLGLIGAGLGDTGNLDHIGYFTTVPAPGALALLGLAGLVGTRRRRA